MINTICSQVWWGVAYDMDDGPTSSFKSVLYRVGRPYWPSCCGGWVGMGQRGGCPQGSMLSLSAAATQIHSLSSSPQLGNSLKRSLDYSVWSSLLAPESSLHFNLRPSRSPDLPDIDMRWVAFSVPYHVPVITIVISFSNSLFIGGGPELHLTISNTIRNSQRHVVPPLVTFSFPFLSLNTCTCSTRCVITDY